MGKCGGRELNYVSDVDVIFVGAGRPRRRHPAGQHDDAGRRQGVLRRSTPRCGPKARPARWSAPWRATRLLPEVGQDLGVPGAAQGAPGRRRRRARPAVRRDGRAAGVVGGRPRELRRRGAADAPPRRGDTCRPSTPNASSSWAAAGCATSSSPCSCCSSCTAASTPTCAHRPRWTRSPRSAEGGYVGRQDAAELGVVRVPADDRAPAAAAAAAPDPPVPGDVGHRRAADAGAGRWDQATVARARASAAGGVPAAREGSGGCTRRSSTGRCCSPSRTCRPRRCA